MKGTVLDTRELAWAAGLFEGEGCIHPRRWRRKDNTVGQGPGLKLGMTDEDAVRRFRDAVGMGVVRFEPARRPGVQPMWWWDAGGFERAQAVIALLWFGLGIRRRARAREVLLTATRPAKRRDSVRARNIQVRAA